MTFFTFDEHEIPADERDVLSASALLQITEFHLFELAYRRWFGRPVAEPQLESIYCGYMFRDRVPFWVRHFCREVLDRERAGRLDPTDFGVYPRAQSDSRFRQGLRFLAIVVSVIVTLHLIAILASAY